MLRCIAVAFAAVSWAAAMAASPASASYNHFCPTTSGSSVYLNGNGFCVSAQYQSLTGVVFITTNGPGVSHCAVGKQQSDGGGSNVIPSSCAATQVVSTVCYSSSPRQGYAKGINQSASPHLFYGYASYTSGCVP